MFSKQSLQQLKDRIDLIDLLGSHLSLKRTGHVYKACCPFHEEKTPSFQVQVGAQHYHCFGCGAHGDAFAFIMHQSGLSFVEAARVLADRYQIVLEEEQNGSADRDRERALQLMQSAQAFFVWCLWNHPEAVSARQYLQARGLSEDFCRRFGLGFCPGPRHELRDYLRAQKFHEEEMQKLGLITASHPPRDFFTHRITFAILDYRFQVIAFSARKYQESTFGGKYINSPETVLFKKSKTLFGLPYARARLTKERRAIIVEGQVDTLRLVESGFNLTVAALGTAFGSDHVAQLKKLGVESVWLLFDGDAAGQEAAAKVGHLFMKEAIEVRVAQLDVGDDPDTALARESGKEHVAERLDGAQGFVDFLVQHRSRGKDLRSPAVKTALIEHLREQIENWNQPLLVYEGIRALARAFCIPESLVMGPHRPIMRQVSKRMRRSTSQDGVGLERGQRVAKHAALEADLLRWLLTMGPSCPAIFEYCQPYITSEDFSTPIYGQLWQAIMARYINQQPLLDFTSALLELDNSYTACIEELGAKRIDPRKVSIHLQETVQEMACRRVMQEAEALRLEIQSARLNDEQAMEKAQKYSALRKALPEIPPFVGPSPVASK